MSNKSRHLERFMPYACDRGGLVIRSVRAAMDGEARGELTSGDPLPSASSPWDTLNLAVALERRADLKGLLHPDELGAPAVALVLAVRCRATFLSIPHCIQHPDPTANKYEYVITLRRNEIRGEVTITPFLVRTMPHTRSAGLASRKGAWLASGDPWIVHVDESKPPPGNGLDVVRKRFSEVPGISPSDHHNWLALQLDGASPRLFLNEEHSAVINALYDTTKRGKRAAVREALYDQVSAVVWPSLLLHAARAWQENDGDIYPWQLNALRLWAKRLWPDDYDLDAGVERLVQRAQNSPADLVLEINAFLQREDQVRHIERLLAEVAQ